MGQLCSPTLVRRVATVPHEMTSITSAALEFVSPAAVRSAIRKEQSKKYNIRKDAEQETSRRKEQRKRGEDELAVSKVFA